MTSLTPYTIETIESSPFAQNSYLIWRVSRPDALVIDPGFDTWSLRTRLEREGRSLAAILNTHGHADHIAGNLAMKKAYPEAPLLIGRNEAALLRDPEANLSGPFGQPFVSPDADRLVCDGERIGYAGFTFEVREIPGHSPGSVVFVCDEFDPPFVFDGDVLFAGSIGRTDLGGNHEQLVQGIHKKLFSLPDATVLYPGHGPATTVGAEKRSNPFVGGRGNSGQPSAAGGQ
jgi:glyoxylase-like metal-dependent hydrolase (beta-lactamase superfamily II)